jgi:hypothetical protein
MRYMIQHWTSLDKNKEKKREMNVAHDFFLGTNKIPSHNHGNLSFTSKGFTSFSLFMGTWSPKSLAKRLDTFSLTHGKVVGFMYMCYSQCLII